MPGRVSLAFDIYTGRGGKSPRLSGMEEAQEMDESNRLTDKDEDGAEFHDRLRSGSVTLICMTSDVNVKN